MNDLWSLGKGYHAIHSGPGRGIGRRLTLSAGLTLLAGSRARASEEIPDAEIRPERFDGPGPATLTLPVARRGGPLPAVAMLHDSLGPDPRGEPYARQLLGAGIAVLDVLADHVSEPELLAMLRALAADPRVDAARLGILGFGQGAAEAMSVALPVAARALLYPACAGLVAAARRTDWAGAPVLLMHGDADRASPPASCAAAVEALGRAGARVRRVEYRGASYAWDHPGFGTEGRILVPAPAGALGDGRVEALPWPALTAASAGTVAGFFARELRL